jgi:hypothetical protein
VSERGHTIGFNEDVVVGQARFHVQTEVVGEPPRVLTSVMQGGRLAHSERRPYPADAAGDLDRIRAAIERQHREVVARLLRGELS